MADWRRVTTGVLAGWLLAAVPAFGQPAPAATVQLATAKPDAAPRADGPPPWEALGARIGACFEREDPVCAAPLVADLERLVPDAAATAWCRGMVELLSGRYESARAALQRAAGSTAAPAGLRERAQSYLDLVESTMEVHAGSQPRKLVGGRVVVYVHPGPDEVLLPYLERVLSQALPRLEATFGRLDESPIRLHVYARVQDLGKVSGLTVEQIRNSGTIALCKYNRVMITSPADFVFGYPWADTVVHELVHHYMTRRGGPQVPLWLHEGLARAFQGVWRDQDPGQLDREERKTLAAARAKNRFIPLAKMSPSLALLPTQDDTALAFAQVHHAVAWLLAKAASRQGEFANAQAFSAQAARLVGLFADGATEDRALQQLIGLTPGAFVTAWRKDLAKVNLDESEQAELPVKRQPLLFRGAGPGPGGLKDLSEQAKQYAELGDRLAVLKRPLAAAIEYRKAIAAHPDQGPLLVGRLARVLLDMGKHAEALEYVTPALSSWPDHAPLYILAGRAHVAAARPKQALDALDAAAWLNPYDPELHALAAQAYTVLGQTADAAAARAREGLVGSLAP